MCCCIYSRISNVLIFNSEEAIFSEYALNQILLSVRYPSPPCWTFCHFCAFSYRFNIRQLFLILIADKYGCHSQTLFVNFIPNHIVYTNCISFYGHCDTTIVHVAWSQNIWVLVFTDTSAPVGLGLWVGVKVRVSVAALKRPHRK